MATVRTVIRIIVQAIPNADENAAIMFTDPVPINFVHFNNQDTGQEHIEMIGAVDPKNESLIKIALTPVLQIAKLVYPDEFVHEPEVE